MSSHANSNFGHHAHEFRDFLTHAGFDVSRHQIQADGKWRNIPLIGQRDGKSGGYCLHLDEHPVGFARNHRTNEQFCWKPERTYTPLTAAERAEMERKAAERAQKKIAEQDRAARKAEYLWGRAQPADPQHPYLQRKEIGADGFRQLGERLVLDLRDPATDRIHSLQFIAPDGTKRLLAGARKEGLVHRFGPEPSGHFAVAEGAASAASVHEALRCPVYMAIDSGNLMSAGLALRARYPEARVLIAADNDWTLPLRDPPLPNVGKEKACELAKAIGASVALPLAETDVTDWNDVAARYGLTAKKWQLRGLYQDHGRESAVERLQAGQSLSL